MRAGTQEVITQIMALTIFQVSNTFQMLNFLKFGSNQRESLNDLGSYYSTNCPLTLLCRVKSGDIHHWPALREMGRKIMVEIEIEFWNNSQIKYFMNLEGSLNLAV